MNYIILNGVKSTQIRGLMIQSLPPITKPMMRTQIDEIDGRDGDIITDLGFQAYDKQIKIGLVGDFNIDDVIAYFNSAGKVTFSNEPDKFYNYKIINRIDFDRLLLFRQATVTFHCQPFKFSVTARSMGVSWSNVQLMSIPNFSDTKNGVTVTVTGNNVGINGTATADTEFFVPVRSGDLDRVILPVGEYIWMAYASGINAEGCSVRLI